MEIGVPIKLYWRKAGNQSFENPSVIKTEEGSLAGKGVIDGKTLVNWAKALGFSVNNVQVLNVPEGSNPTNATSKLLLNPETIYNMYVCLDSNGENSLYLELETSEISLESEETVMVYYRKVMTESFWRAEGCGEYSHALKLQAGSSFYGGGAVNGHLFYLLFTSEFFTGLEGIKIIHPETGKSQAGFIGAFQNDRKSYNRFVIEKGGEKQIFVDAIYVKE